ncbi:MAG TPA: serpin family protein [Dehalococcoidia bacterium]|nr:serpin family protein [Dehalococcoidia bacterium]
MRQHNDDVNGWRLAGGVVILVMTGLLAASCGSDAAPGPDDIVPADVGEAKSDLERETGPDISESTVAQLAADNQRFAADLYSVIREEDGNLIFSPYSMSSALAMTYAGARGMTEEEMASALRWTLARGELHPAFNKLDLDLESLGLATPAPGVGEGEPLRLSVANSVWVQAGLEVIQEFLDVLATNYGAGMRTVDFVNAAEAARQAINDWVSEETAGRIKDLIPPGAIDDLTRLVLTNAIYFKASWLEPFDPKDTADGAFHLLDGSEVTVPMMQKAALRTRYAEAVGVQAVEIPYYPGNASFMLILPPEGGFESFEESLDAETIDEILSGMSDADVNLRMPKFEFESDVDLKEPLKALGMVKAFDFEQADFTGIAVEGVQNLYISDALHKAFISVNEEGTEAAASTAVIVGDQSAYPVAEVRADRAFVFLIRDNVTGTVLFIGRVVDPTR